MKVAVRWAVPVVLAMVSSGCVLAPGQSVNPPNAFFRDDADVQVLPISSKLMAQLQASDQASAQVPTELLSHKPSDYRVGSGDVLNVTIWNQPELMLTGTTSTNPEQAGRVVRPDGTIFYPFAGVVKVTGLTLDEVRTTLTQRLTKVLQSPQLDVSVSRYGSQKVYLGGAFRRSQPLEITTVPLSLTEAIGRGEVSTTDADLSGLILKRDGVTYPINIETLGLDSSSASRIFLKHNDELYIPYNDRRKVYLMGELQQQRALAFKTTGISLADALSSAGGLRQETSKSEAVYVIRDTSPAGRPGAVTTIFTLDSDSPTALALSASFQLKPSDVVYVGTAQISRWNRFLSQLFPSASLVNQAQNIRNDN